MAKVFKLYFQSGNAEQEPEVRKLTVDKRLLTTFTAFREMLINVFPSIPTSSFSVSYIDIDGDKIAINSDNEYATALAEMKDRPVLKFYIQMTSGVAKNQKGGVDCSGCSKTLVSGHRFRCVVCPEFHLCRDCEASGEHHDHNMVRTLLEPQEKQYLQSEESKKDLAKRFLETLTSGTQELVSKPDYKMVTYDPSKELALRFLQTLFAGSQEQNVKTYFDIKSETLSTQNWAKRPDSRNLFKESLEAKYVNTPFGTMMYFQEKNRGQNKKVDHTSNQPKVDNDQNKNLGNKSTAKVVQTPFGPVMYFTERNDKVIAEIDQIKKAEGESKDQNSTSKVIQTPFGPIIFYMEKLDGRDEKTSTSGEKSPTQSDVQKNETNIGGEKFQKSEDLQDNIVKSDDDQKTEEVAKSAPVGKNLGDKSSMEPPKEEDNDLVKVHLVPTPFGLMFFCSDEKAPEDKERSVTQDVVRKVPIQIVGKEQSKEMTSNNTPKSETETELSKGVSDSEGDKDEPTINYVLVFDEKAEKPEDSHANCETKINQESIPTKSSEVEENDNIPEALKAMMEMGFSNEGGWLTKLLETKQGNVTQALKVLSPAAAVCK